MGPPKRFKKDNGIILFIFYFKIKFKKFYNF